MSNLLSSALWKLVCFWDDNLDRILVGAMALVIAAIIVVVGIIFTSPPPVIKYVDGNVTCYVYGEKFDCIRQGK